MKRTKNKRSPGFTLVELILVMAILTIVMAIAAPKLARSMRGRHLKEEATRLVALTEYGRDEAVSQGVPMVVWVDAASGRFGVQPKAGFTGVESRSREYTLGGDVSFDTAAGELKPAALGEVGSDVAEFAPDGAPDSANIESLKLTDRFGESVEVVRTTDGWGYEVVID